MEEGPIYDMFDDYDQNQEDNSKQIEDRRDKYENPLLNDFTAFINEELSEPDIIAWCRDSEEATSLLRKCIKWMNEKNWQIMKKYLQELGKFCLKLS